jgi:hypothetical protein
MRGSEPLRYGLSEKGAEVLLVGRAGPPGQKNEVQNYKAGSRKEGKRARFLSGSVTQPSRQA